MDGSRDHHASDRRTNRKERVAKRSQFPDVNFTFQFQPNQQEKNGHQSIVDPMFDGHACNVVMHPVKIRIRKRGIRDDKSQKGKANEHNPAGSFTFDKVLKKLGCNHVSV